MKIFYLLFLFSIMCYGKNTISKKIQEHDFEGADVEGVSRSPNNSLLIQKKKIKFIPMYKIKEKFETEINNSVKYLE